MPSVACDYGACSAPRAPGQPTGEVRRICVRRASAPRPLGRLEGCAACTRSNAVAHAWTSAARGIHGDLDDLGAGDAGGVPNAGGLGTIRPRGHACRYLAFGHADERIPSPAVTLRGLGWAGRSGGMAGHAGGARRGEARRRGPGDRAGLRVTTRWLAERAGSRTAGGAGRRHPRRGRPWPHGRARWSPSRRAPGRAAPRRARRPRVSACGAAATPPRRSAQLNISGISVPLVQAAAPPASISTIRQRLISRSSTMRRTPCRRSRGQRATTGRGWPRG